MVMVCVFFAVSILSSIAGSICGIGGGVIIKPVLDAVGVMSVSSISGKAQCAYRNRAGDRCGSGRCCRKEYVPDVEICRGQ